jgi:preprotein translocase subunit SecY
MRIEIPLSYGKYKGIRGRYPIKFIYASNIPMNLTIALFANVRVMAQLTHWNILGSFTRTGTPSPAAPVLPYGAIVAFNGSR